MRSVRLAPPRGMRGVSHLAARIDSRNLRGGLRESDRVARVAWVALWKQLQQKLLSLRGYEKPWGEIGRIGFRRGLERSQDQ